MALISFDPDVAVEYIPESERDSDDPCVIMLKFVPYSKVQTYSRMIANKTKGVNGNAKIAEITQGVQRRQFEDSVESISNYSVGGKDITEAGDFYDTADTDLIIEVIHAMESAQKLTEGQRKN